MRTVLSATAVTVLVVVVGLFVGSHELGGARVAAGDASAAAGSEEASDAPTSSLPSPEQTARKATLLAVARQVTLHARPHHPDKKKPTPAPTLDFVISSFNALGASHTAGGGSHGRYASGSLRARWAAQILAIHDVDVVGFQELQTVQLRSFLAATGGAYDVYPGDSLGSLGAENSIGWRRDTWQLVSADTVSIPYFGGHRRPMPYVLLRNPATGLEAWFANFHNPADTGSHPHQQRWRSAATAVEVGLANRLAGTGKPVFVTGDMNARDGYFCAMTGGAPMISASGGSNEGACRPPRDWYVDWIFGSQGVTFSAYAENRGPLVRRTTDHPVIVSTAHLTGAGAAD